MAIPTTADGVTDSLSFVVCVNDHTLLRECLMASPGLAAGHYRVLPYEHCTSAAAAFNAALALIHTHWLVFVHQDVYLPDGWDAQFRAGIAAARAQWPNLAVVGVYGMQGALRLGHVRDRDQRLREPATLPAAADTLDELCFAVRRDAGLHLDPALGFDFYAADVALQARAQGLAVAVVDAFCEHRSRLPRVGFTEAFIARFGASATHFQNKWRHRLPIATPSITLSATPSAAEQVRAVTGPPVVLEDVLGTDPGSGPVPKTTTDAVVPHWRWERLLSELVFRVLLPLAARWPFGMGAALATLRGRRDAQRDRDWRCLSLRHPYVKAATTGALRELLGAVSPQVLEQAVTQRFVTASLEEWQAHLIMAGRAPRLRMDVEGMDPAQLKQQAALGTVWMTAHFDSVMLGIVHLGLAGVSFNLMTSTVVEDERIPASIRRYYVQKYAAMARYFNGGRALQAERHLKSFYAGVREGRSAVVLVDAPALKKEEGLLLEFLGKPRYMAPGAVRLAQFTGAPLGAFLCIRVAADHYRLVVHPPITPGAEGYPAAAQQLYDFMSRHIMQQPGRWWAADLLPTMIRGD